MNVINRTAPVGARLSAVRNRPGAISPTAPAHAPAAAPARWPIAAEAPALAVPRSAPDALPGTHDYAMAVTALCAAAGFADLIAPMLRANVSLTEVRHRLEVAPEIVAIAKSVGLPRMAAPVLRSGASLEEARHLLFDAKAAADAGIRTDTSPPAERRTGSSAEIDPMAIHKRNNERHLPADGGQRSGGPARAAQPSPQRLSAARR